ncbi:signal peptidase I [Rhizobium sp. Root483D2]|uniref:signal peptidase I n=1 Tax=Rhizobium sp. Root483D2 TaxID=1736545 RepID=UPI000714559A|nr:signal peptidase I [Rhizobium sp. Root483D2]KQY36114.1 hypothetical protein ASD32_19300 [Rhizobium sp. Root483D2]
MYPELRKIRYIATVLLIILLTPPLFVIGIATIAATPVVLAGTIRTFIVQPFAIPGSSMFPTLEKGDRLLANKFAYGYKRFSYPFDTGPEFRTFGVQPKRGDVVIFRYPPDPAIDYVKRIIGEPGDRIRLLAGRLYINDEIVPREKRGINPALGDSGQNLIEYLETLPGGKTYPITEVSDDEASDNTDEFLVPPKHYFMMGDNRDNSADSRYDVGFVPEENIYAKASLVFTNDDDPNRSGWIN